jgi:hypothetical protein
LLRHVVSPEFAEALFQRHRGTGYDGGISFATLVELTSDALLEHSGSGRQSFERGRADGRLTTTARAVYGKLGRVRLALSQAFLAEATVRASQALPAGTLAPWPPSLSQFHVVAIDGKKIKNLAKRLKPLRRVSGQTLGGKAVVALWLNARLAVALEASPDGEANDAPLTPGLIKQVRTLLPGPVLYLADRQFCDLTIPAEMQEGNGRFIVRYAKKMGFFPSQSVSWRDSQNREVREEQGWLGSPRDERRLFVRRLTLIRPGEEDVSVVTDLLDADAVPGQDVLAAYLQRWSIERVFQQVTEVFGLKRLIGSTPQGALFQFSLCLLLYNLIQIVLAYVAEDQQIPVATISSELLFRDVRDQMTAGSLFLDRQELIRELDVARSPEQVQRRLRELLHGRWTPAWKKAPFQKRTAPRTNLIRVPGGHSSAWKLIQAAKNTADHPP